MENKLTDPPTDERARELWLQHAAGFIIFEDMRKYADENIPEGIDEKTRIQIKEGIDNTIYGLMMIMDGVTGSLSNENYKIHFETKIILKKNGKVIQEIDTFEGDGMCMGFHSWKEGNFGDDELFVNSELK